MSINQYFSTSIYRGQLSDKTKLMLNRDLLKEIKQIQDIDDLGQDWSKQNYAFGYTSYSSMSELHLSSPNFISLKTKIDSHVLKFAKHLDFDLGGKKLFMSNCWVNVMPKGATHSGHIHPLSFISGTYYVQTPRNASLIKFEDPRLSMMMNAPAKKLNTKTANKNFISCKPEAGGFLLWESWLRHEVPVNLSKQERISVSFNYSWSEA